MERVEKAKLIVRTITVAAAIALFALASAQFNHKLGGVKKGVQIARKYRISDGRRDYLGQAPGSKVDPSRVGLVKVDLNIAISEYLASIAMIGVATAPLILVTRRKS